MSVDEVVGERRPGDRDGGRDEPGHQRVHAQPARERDPGHVRELPAQHRVGRVGIDTRPLRELALHLFEAERRDGGAPDAPGGLLRALLFGRGRIGAAWVMRWAPSSTPSKSRETPEGVPCRVSEGFVMKLSTASTGRAAA